MPLPRRKFLKQSAIVAAASVAAPRWLSKLSAADAAATSLARPMPPAPTPILPPAGWGVMDGPFQPTWESLAAYKSAPDWFRDAKFGMWAHWGPQCVPEQGDWYAQKMYLPTDPDYAYHVKTYGHPSKFGFKDILPILYDERWELEYLIWI